MSAPVPESPDLATLANSGGLINPADAAAVMKAGASAFSVPAMLQALKAPSPFQRTSSDGGPQISDIRDAASHNPLKDLGAAAKNIVDFVETPFYILTNTLDSHFTREDNGNPDPNSLGSMLDDLRQGVQKGVEAGVDHNPAYAKDWTDVIKHAQKGTPDEGNDAAANAVGIGADLLVDPINAIPGTGLGKFALKAPAVAIGAAKEAGKGAASLVEKGAADVAAKTSEAIGDAARPSEAAASAAADGVNAGQNGAAGAVAAPPVAMSGPEQAVADYKSIPAIANVLKNQDLGKTQAIFNALGQEFKTSVTDSDVGKIIKGFKEGFNKPLAVSPETVLEAHLEGIANKDSLEKEAAPTMAVPDKIKTLAPTEEIPKAPAPVADKQEDLVNSAAANTVRRSEWEEMSPDKRQQTRTSEAKLRTESLNEPIVAKKQDGTKVTIKGDGPTGQKQAVDNIVNATKDYQAGHGLSDIGAKGFKGDLGRTTGKSAEEAGGIRHPMLYDTHANQVPFQKSIEAIKDWDTVLTDPTRESRGLSKGSPIARYGKPEIVNKLLKTAESQLQAAGMIPVLNMSKYAGKVGEDAAKNIHLTLGDALEASIAKTVRSAKGRGIFNNDRVFSKNEILKHLIGSSDKDAVNPMALSTAMETLIHERSRLFDEIKAHGAAMLPDDLERELAKSQQSIKDVLMGEAKAYGGSATKADLDNIKETINTAVTKRGKGGAATYEKDMDTLAHKILYDPHLGTMLEQRHLYNQAMHAADMEKFVANNWADLKSRLESVAAGPWTNKQTLDWLNKQTRDTKYLLPPVDRKNYSDWIDQLKKQVITPAEEKAVHAVDPKTTIVDSGKDAVQALKDSGEAYDKIDEYAGQIATDVMRSIHPVESFFNAKFPFLATSGFYGSVMQGKHSLAQVQTMTHSLLTNYMMKYNKAGQILEDTKAVIRAAVDKVPVEGESVQELQKTLNAVFSTDTRYVRAMQRGLVDKSYMETMFRTEKYKGILDSIDSKWWAKADKSNLHEFWQHIDFKDAEQTADIISKLHFAVLDVNSKLAMARSFEKEFGSAVAKEGHSKISWDAGRGTRSPINRVGAAEKAAAERAAGFYDLLDKSLYYDRGAAWEIPALHRFINESRRVSNDTRIGQFINNVFDPITQVMKATQTTLRPGHWVSNVMGDTIRNFLAGVTDPRSYYHNMRIMAAIGRDQSLFAENIPAKLERATMIAGGQYAKKIPASERKYLVPVRINGTVKYYTATELGRMLEDRIFLSPHGVGGHEDYIIPEERDITSKLAGAAVKGTDALLSNKFYDLNKWSAIRDNLTRGTLAVDTLIHGDHASIEDALNKAFNRVRKWAPTSADFSREESMTARRAILYYTWLRGMIPNIIETMVEKPGVFMAPNRALYGIAKANGVEPMSIGNPFPVNQQFPTYYYENIIGPQFKVDGGALWGISPMAPSIDVLDTILKPNPAANLLGMSNPFIKTPIELATGQSNGIPIKDPGQYLQDNLLPPQLSVLSKGMGTELYNPTQNRTDKGNSPDVPGTGIPANVFNFFTGLHATDFNDQPALRSVAAEAKNAKSAARSDAQRAAR